MNIIALGFSVLVLGGAGILLAELSWWLLKRHKHTWTKWVTFETGTTYRPQFRRCSTCGPRTAEDTVMDKYAADRPATIRVFADGYANDFQWPDGTDTARSMSFLEYTKYLTEIGFEIISVRRGQ